MDLRHDGHSQYEATLADIECRLSHLLLQAGSPQTKIAMIQSKILPVARYTAIVANWTLAQYRALDIPLSSAYRRILAMPKKFPQALLYLPITTCGMGLPRLSDHAQILKWENFQRCLAVGGAPQRAVEQMLARLPQTTLPSTTRVRTLIPTSWPPRLRYTARSVVEWLHESELCLACRVDPTHEELEAHRENYAALRALATNAHFWPSPESTTRLDDLPRELERIGRRTELWPDPELWGHDQELPRVSAFFTDGSYSLKTPVLRDIITPEAHLRDEGLGSGGIVFLPCNDDPYRTPQHPILIRITSPAPEPGMNAYTWELVTQLIALNLAKYLPSSVPGYSDCKAAIARTTQSLRTLNDQLATTKAGIYSTAMHALANIEHPRDMRWVKGHPEEDRDRRDLTAEPDLGIFMADTVAEHDTRGLRARGLPDHIITLNFRHVLNEIIPVGQWHVRSCTPEVIPVLDDLLPHQHRVALREYLAQRDKRHSSDYWTTTSLALTHKLHPPVNSSHWARARRTLTVFDWTGHGRNLEKQATTPEAKRAARACKQCGSPDSQHHCMLDCAYPALRPIRQAARIEQSKVATSIRANPKYNAHHRKFAEQFCLASWQVQQPNIERVWLGLWNEATLSALMERDPFQRISTSSRHKYIKIARLLTAPLLAAYRQLMTLRITANDSMRCDDQLSPYERNIDTPENEESTLRDRLEREALFPQADLDQQPNPPIPLAAARTCNSDPFANSDSAFRLAECEVV